MVEWNFEPWTDVLIYQNTLIIEFMPSLTVPMDCEVFEEEVM